MPVLGLRGTGAWSSDERPKNYRERILLLFPNAKVPLTALLSKLKVETTDDPEFKIFTKTLPTQRTLVVGSHSSSVTTIAVTSTTANRYRAGAVIRNERTDEVMWVVADPSSPYDSIEVVRGKGSSAASMNNGDGLVQIGSAHQEGASRPTAVTYDPSVGTNWTQIFRNSLDLTNTARATHLRTGSDLTERQRETLELHAIDMEMAYIFGTGVEDTSGAQPKRTTKGFVSLVTTNVTNFAGEFDIDTWESALKDIFADGSSEKLALFGNTALLHINKIGRTHGEIQMTPGGEAYGMKLFTYMTPFGTLQMAQHPLLSKNPTYASWGIIVDTAYLVDRTLNGNGVNRDTQYLEGRQNAGDDRTTDEWLTEKGLELQFETVNGVMKNITGFIP